MQVIIFGIDRNTGWSLIKDSGLFLCHGFAAGKQSASRHRRSVNEWENRGFLLHYVNAYMGTDLSIWGGKSFEQKSFGIKKHY